jgi:hypothetical protein
MVVHWVESVRDLAVLMLLRMMPKVGMPLDHFNLLDIPNMLRTLQAY